MNSWSLSYSECTLIIMTKEMILTRPIIILIAKIVRFFCAV